MCDRIPYKTIVACKLGDEEALKTILKHYEPLIVEASKKENGSWQRHGYIRRG